MGTLTAAFVRSVRHRGGGRRYADHHYDRYGLYLQVSPSGAKQWVQRLVLDGRRRDYGLGSYDFMTLGQAREQAFDNARTARVYRRARAAGELPPVPEFERRRRDTLARKRGTSGPTGEGAEEAPRTGALTFAQAFEACVAERSKRWKNPETDTRSWLADLRIHWKGVAPLAVAAVDVDHIAAAVEGMRPKTEDKALRRAAVVFEYAIARKYRAPGDNPAKAFRQTRAGLKREATEHRKSLPWRELPALWARLVANGTGADARGALALVVVSGLRSKEASGTHWGEVDWTARTLTVPASRMKDGREFTVPLSEAACAVLRAAGPKAEGLVFRAPQGGALTDMHLRATLAETGAECTVHGMRGTLRSWGADHGVSAEVMESCLSHSFGSKVAQSYQHSNLLERRRAVLEQYGAFATGARR